MAKKLGSEEIVALARLAKLHLSDDEVDKYRDELGAILEYVEQLASVDTGGLEPTSQVTGLFNQMREDTVEVQQATPEALIRLAPKSKDGYIQVGRMI